MQAKQLLLVLALLALGASVAMAGDVVAMPTGNPVPAGAVEFHVIYWDREPISTPGGPVRDYMYIGEVFVGVTDRLELDYLYVDPQGMDAVWEINAYYTWVKESAEHPSVIVGVTNITAEDWLPSSQRMGPQGDNRPSYFAVGAYNILVPDGPPSLDDPLVRLHLGYGDHWHESRFFGAAQVLFHPAIGVAVLNYQGQPAYLASFKPHRNIELNAGWDAGDPLGHLSWRCEF